MVGFEIKRDEVTSLKRLLDHDITAHLAKITEISDQASRYVCVCLMVCVCVCVYTRGRAVTMTGAAPHCYGGWLVVTRDTSVCVCVCVCVCLCVCVCVHHTGSGP